MSIIASSERDGVKRCWCRLRKTHPGPVVHISDNQTDPNKVS